MRALIKKENKPECMEVGQVEKPSCPDDHVLIHVLAGGVCGTDLHIRTGEWVCGKVPVVMGHEFCGEIAEWADLQRDLSDQSAGSLEGRRKRALVPGHQFAGPANSFALLRSQNVDRRNVWRLQKTWF